MKLGLLSLVDYHPGKGLTQVERFNQVVEEAVLADQLGFDTFWVGEHHFNNYICSNPVPVLAAIAARTERIRIGTGVALPAHHDPVQMAEDYATVDVLSNGRLDLVLSRGVFQNAFVGFGQNFEERGERMREAIEIIRGCWSDECFTYDGKFTSCSNLSVQPRPVQSPHPPIWVGCGSEDSARAAADAGLNLSLFDFPGLIDPKPLADAFRGRLAELGLDPKSRLVSFGRHVYLAETEAVARQEFEPHYRNYFTMPLPGGVAGRPDEDDPGAKGIQAIDFSMVPADRLFTNALCTDPDTAVDYIQRLVDEVDIDHYWCSVDMGAQPDSQVHKTLRIIAEQVLPRLG